MPGRQLLEKRLSGANVFRGVLLDVWRDEVALPDGTSSIREYIRHPGAALIVPIMDDGRLIFVRQFRYALGRVMVELPAGKLDPGEEPAVAAARELAEEIGYHPGQLTRLGLIHPCIGYSDEQIEVYLATELEPAAGASEHDEFLEPFELGLEEALEWVREGKITDVKTIIALYWTERHRAGTWLPK
ncbi:MAG: NUDIX hydrolase [Candidatus Marinimicrobia bacterium]|nr:NUDIX hydrolase [Candidatus Neomarinimicrobiota bacterium]